MAEKGEEEERWAELGKGGRERGVLDKQNGPGDCCKYKFYCNWSFCSTTVNTIGSPPSHLCLQGYTFWNAICSFFWFTCGYTNWSVF
jgi:hypothetical protein